MPRTQDESFVAQPSAERADRTEGCQVWPENYFTPSTKWRDAHQRSLASLPPGMPMRGATIVGAAVDSVAPWLASCRVNHVILYIDRPIEATEGLSFRVINSSDTHLQTRISAAQGILQESKRGTLTLYVDQPTSNSLGMSLETLLTFLPWLEREALNRISSEGSTHYALTQFRLALSGDCAPNPQIAFTKIEPIANRIEISVGNETGAEVAPARVTVTFERCNYR